MALAVAGTCDETRTGTAVGGRADSDLEGRAGSEANRPVWPAVRTDMARVQVDRGCRPDG